MPNTYRNPRYMIDHAYQQERAAITAPASDPPISRVVDGQNQRAAEISQATLADVDFDREAVGAANIRVPLDRIIVAGHNSVETATQILPLTSADDITYTQRVLTDGSTVGTAGSTGPLDFEVERDPVSGTNQYERIEFGAGDGNHQVGEIYASSMLTTNSGIVQTWRDTDEPNSVVAETFAHNIYTLERGSERRVWRMKYEGINDTDARMLQHVRDTVGLQVHPFWFDPPASGAVVDLTTWDTGDTGGWAGSANLDVTFDATGSQSSGPIVIVTANTSPAGSVQASYTLPNAPVDLRGKIFRFDLQQRSPLFVAGSGDLRFRIVSSTSPFPRSEYPLGQYFLNYPISTRFDWIRYEIDLDSSAVAAITQANLDPSRVLQIGFGSSVMNQDDQFSIANTSIVEKSEQVAFVELLSFDKRQTSPSPKFQLAWDIDVVVREVLS